MWAPRSDADFNWVQSLDNQDFYFGVKWDNSGKKWRYADDDSLYPDKYANWKSGGQTGSSSESCLKLGAKNTLVIYFFSNAEFHYIIFISKCIIFYPRKARKERNVSERRLRSLPSVHVCYSRRDRCRKM